MPRWETITTNDPFDELLLLQATEPGVHGCVSQRASDDPNGPALIFLSIAGGMCYECVERSVGDFLEGLIERGFLKSPRDAFAIHRGPHSPV